MNRLLAAGLLLAATLFSACSPGINIRRPVPARYNLGVSRRLALIDVDGAPEARSRVADELRRQITQRGHFELYQAMDSGITLHIPGTNARIELGDVRQRIPADLYMIADVRDYRLEEIPPTEKTVPKVAGVAEVTFQVVKSDGRVVVADTYRAREEKEVPKDRNYSDVGDLRPAAMDHAVADFLSDITPYFVSEKIQLDEDEILKPGIELADKGDLDGAKRSWDAVLASHPSHAGAVFNLGVILEVRGEFDAAAQTYKRAIGMQPKELYIQTLERLERRQADLRALEQRL
jgi:tetratricopeptide (TPR) repeat protein